MRLTMGRLAAVLAGVCTWVGGVSAQGPLLPPPPEASAGGVVLVNGGGGCPDGSCGPRSLAPTPDRGPITAVAHGLMIGQGCPNPVGCGTLVTERNFVFGSCRQFFNPGNDCLGPCGRINMLYGKGGLSDGSPCCYGSYMNR